MRSYLVVGNQTLDSPELAQAIMERVASGPATFHLVVPATPIQRGLTWGDEDEARAVARDRLTAAIGRLRETGAKVSGEIGHRDPIEATEDALRGPGRRDHPVHPPAWHLPLARAGCPDPAQGICGCAGDRGHDAARIGFGRQTLTCAADVTWRPASPARPR